MVCFQGVAQHEEAHCPFHYVPQVEACEKHFFLLHRVDVFMVLVRAAHLPFVGAAEYEPADVYGIECSEGEMSVVDYRHGKDNVWLWHQAVSWHTKKDSQSERKSQVGYQHEVPHVVVEGIEILSYLRRPRALMRLR